MKKSVKIGFPIVCVGIIAITFGMMADIKNRVEDNKLRKTQEKYLENQISNSENNIEKQNENISYDGNVDRAISLLEDEIDDINVYFTSEGIEDGRYIIAVRDTETTEAKQYYIIDLEKEEVEIYY